MDKRIRQIIEHETARLCSGGHCKHLTPEMIQRHVERALAAEGFQHPSAGEMQKTFSEKNDHGYSYI